jgi:outer membrane protein assembly factor BamB
MLALALASVVAVSGETDDGSALLAAVRTADIDGVKQLVAAGAPIDEADAFGMTPLVTAASMGNLEIVDLLLEGGADPDLREGFYHNSAASWAMFRGHPEVAIRLLEGGSDDREEALGFALRSGDAELAAAAVDNGPIHASVLAELRAGADRLDPVLRAVLERAESRPDPQPPALTEKELARYVGDYEARTGGETAEIALERGRLVLRQPGSDPIPLNVVAEHGFRSEEGDLLADFYGRTELVEGLTIRRGDTEPIGMRRSVAEPVAAMAGGRREGRWTGAAEGNRTVHWPRFRGANAEGIGDGFEPPVDWDLASGRGVLWQVELPGLGNSSPIVWGDRVFVTTAVAEGIEQGLRTGLTGAGDPVDEQVEHSWRVIAYDKRDGKQVWETEVGRAVPLTRRHFKASQANATPVTDGRHLVVVFPTAGLACLDLDGKLKWKHDLGGLNASSPNDPGTEWGYASSPVIYEDRVILQVDTYDDPHLAAWDLETARQLWRVERDVPPTWATPTVVRHEGGDELVVNGPTIIGYDPASGEELWSVGPNSELVIATPVVGDGVVYVSAGYAPIKPIYAVRLGTRGAFEVEPGEEHERLAWSYGRGGAYMPTPLLYEGLLYVVHHNGRIVAYDAAGGAPIYKARFSKGGTFTA